MTELPEPIDQPLTASEPQERRPRRPRVGLLLAPLLLVVLAAASFIGPGDATSGLSLADPDRTRAEEVRAVLAALPQKPLVLVGMDPDLGTYPEIRPAVRAALDDLLANGAQLALISFSPEGRAIAAVEIDRLRGAGATDASLLDLGFVAGAEAGLVRSVSSPVPPGAESSLAGSVRLQGIAAFDVALLVGGVDFGPRSWVEQVGTRLPDLPMVAIAPTVSQPELAPYLRTGQLSGLLATVRDDAAYVALVTGETPGTVGSEAALPSSLAMLVGMLAARAVMLVTLLPGVRGRGEGDDHRLELEEAEA